MCPRSAFLLAAVLASSGCGDVSPDEPADIGWFTYSAASRENEAEHTVGVDHDGTFLAVVATGPIQHEHGLCAFTAGPRLVGHLPRALLDEARRLLGSEEVQRELEASPEPSTEAAACQWADHLRFVLHPQNVVIEYQDEMALPSILRPLFDHLNLILRTAFATGTPYNESDERLLSQRDWPEP